MGELNSVIEWLVLARNEKCLPGEEAAFDKAIEILKAHEPKAVVGIADFDTIIAIGGCPACDKSIVNKSDDPTKYCKFCVQAVKWNVE